MSKPTLAYWKTRGLAQPIRLLLEYCGQDFEDKHYELGDAPDYSTEEWLKEKNVLGLDFPNLPYYIEGDIKITQSNSIIRYLATKHGLLGSTEKEKVICDMMLENAMDFRNGVIGIAYNKDYENLKEDYFKNVAEKLRSFERFLGNKRWFAGDNITACDFPMYELLNQHELMKPGILDGYENLKKFTERFEELPKIKAYMASNRFMERPINNKFAPFK